MAVKGLDKEDVEMIQGRYARAKFSASNPILKFRAEASAHKNTYKKISFELADEFVVFDIDDYANDDEMFSSILTYLTSVGVY